MGAGCCSSGPKQDAPSGGEPSTANHDSHDQNSGHDHAHVHAHNAVHAHGDHGHDQSHDQAAAPEHEHFADENDCAEKGAICEDAACCDADNTCSSATKACCDTDDEHCDEKCIIDAAALECKNACETGGEAPDASPLLHEHKHDDAGHHPPTACSDHLAKAFDQYKAYLESARCICHSVLERGWSQTCCSSQPQKMPLREQYTSTAVSSSSAYQPAHHQHAMKRRNKSHPVRLASDKDSCCSDEKDSCCGIKKDSCWDGDHIEATHDFKKLSTKKAVDFTDLEKADGVEHLALQIEGMTCSGCGNKMEKGLKDISGVSNVRVNFVMGQAECNIDTSVTTSDEVIRNAERATGFKCLKLSNDDQALDILASGSVAKSLMDLEISGVTGTSIINKKAVRVNYNPTIIGARDLLSALPPGIGGLAPPRDDPSISSGRKRLYDQLAKTVVAAILTIPVLVLAWGDTPVHESTKAIISLVLATFVQMIAIPDFYRPAISSLVYNHVVEMDMLVVISITAAYLYSVVAFGFRMADRPLETAEFFETSTLLITLVIFGRLVAAFARVRAVQAVSLRSLQATSAVVVGDGEDKHIDARLLQYGDKFKVGAHTAVPTDGVVVSGSSDVDESMLTGESVPVFKKEGDEVIAGTVNGTGTIVARLTRLPGMNTVTDIARLVEEAANSKPRIQDAADRVAGWFVPIVTTIAVIIIIVWVVVGLKVRNYNGGQAASNAITYAVATLAVSCPCALGLAVPMVLVIAGGVAARSGVIIKSAECTERARKVTDVVFDKTGTITETGLDVMVAEFFDTEEELAISITKPLVAGNNHPVSLGVAKYLANRNSKTIAATDIHVIPGAGVEAKFDSDKIRAGNPSWTQTDNDFTVKNLKSQGLTLLVVTRNSKPIAAYGLRTRLRAESFKVVERLTRRGIAVHIVSGDLQQAVDSVASQVGISNVAAQKTPSQKRDYVASLMAEGKTVMFVGDGTNDAVAVTQADVGVQIASAVSASEVTRGAADVVLLNGLEGIPFIIAISRVSFRRMVFNFMWSAIYNVLAILFASGALVKVRIPPAYAGLGEIVSVLPVIFAAMTMLLKKIKVD